MLAGKVLTVNMLEVNCFQIPFVLDQIPFAFCVTTHSPHERNDEFFLIDVAQVYRVYMTWELAFNAAMGMKRI